MNHGLTHIARLILFKLPLYSLQMLGKVSLQSYLTRLNSLSRSRKIILLVLFILVFLYFLGPSIFNLHRPSFDTTGECLADRLHEFYRSKDQFDAFVNIPGKENQKVFPAYVGNGKLATSLDGSRRLFVRLNRALSLPLSYYPVITTSVPHLNTRDATVLDIRSGVAHKIKTVSTGGWRSSCQYVNNQIYAHRSRPGVLVQDIKISNPSQKKEIVVELDQVGESGWAGSASTDLSVTTSSGQSVTATLTSGVVSVPDSKFLVHAIVGSVKLKDTKFIVSPQETKRVHVVTSVRYTHPAESVSPKIIQDMKKEVEQELKDVVRMDEQTLRSEHVKVWNRLWQSGFGISYSKASDALNGDRINITMYYVLSNVPAPLHDISTTPAQKKDIERTLYFPDRCYSGHSTLFAKTLWMDVSDEEDIARVTTTWMITLEKQGCKVMVYSGAEGVLQAMLLSIGALKFQHDHLEFTMEPKDLHRDLFFHRINYGNNTHVNISVVVGEDNKANMYVALDRNDRPYYACDAGCIDKPMPLSKELKQFPVKLTRPLTAILYITADKLHMEELKHAIHVQEINEAPAHEHHVIALHKHGHHFGGLPTIFWVSIAFLVIIFHLFLCKMIYNEYCQGQDRFTRTRYNV